jgi:hypothetical protein
VERRHLRSEPAGERREIREILRRKGLSGDVLEGATEQIASNREAAIQLMLTDEYGLPPVEPDPMRAAIATFLAFLVAGFVPLLPFIFSVPNAFTVSAVVTGVVFFGIGAAKSIWSLAPGGARGWRRCSSAGRRRVWLISWARSSPPEGGLYPAPARAYTPPHDASLRHRHSNYRPGALIQDAGTKVLELSHRPDIPLT